jgi:hypothetical protein
VEGREPPTEVPRRPSQGTIAQPNGGGEGATDAHGVQRLAGESDDEVRPTARARARGGAAGGGY